MADDYQVEMYTRMRHSESTPSELDRNRNQITACRLPARGERQGRGRGQAGEVERGGCGTAIRPWKIAAARKAAVTIAPESRTPR